MERLLPLAEKIGERLKERGETVAVAESSAGGLISAALLSVAGASAYYRGGSVIYTLKARRELLRVPEPLPADVPRAAIETYAALLAETARQQLGANWGIGESGATGPTGNPYGDQPGHSCIAVAGPVSRAVTLETGSADRVDNMRAFALRALELLAEALG